MEQIFIDFEERLSALHTDLHNILDQLPSEALDWNPGADMNSIAVLITHLTSVERYLIGSMVAGDSSKRVREAEFEARGLTASELKEQLSNSIAYIRTVLSKLTLANLDSLREAPQHNRSFTVGWCLLHTLEHTAIHVGHVHITQQLWRQQT